MTSETPDPAVKPQVIDLNAEDITVEDDPAADAAPLPPPPPAPRKNRFHASWLALAIIAGAVLGGWLYRDVLSSYFPSNQMVSAENSIAGLQAQNKTLGEQVTAVAAATSQMKTDIDTLSSTVNATSQKSADLGLSLEARLATVESIATALRAEIDKLKTLPPATSPTSTTTTTGADSSALASLAQRLDAVEKDVASLKASPSAGGQSEVSTNLTQALSDLKAKIAAGVSYRAEYDRISRMVPAAAGLDKLAPYADEGLPTPQGLAKELSELIPLLPKAATETTSDGGYVDSFWNMMKGLVTIRNIGEADWQGLAAQCVALAESGDLAQAIEKIDRAEGVKPEALMRWRDRAASRIQLEATVEDTSLAVTRQITSVGAAP